MLTKNVHEETASCRPPEIPWPEVQPPARRAPNMRMKPPMRAAAYRLARDGPNRSVQTLGGVRPWKSLASHAARNAPAMRAMSSAICQSRMGLKPPPFAPYSLRKYALASACSGATLPMRHCAAPTKEVLVPRALFMK